jgi:hypothetical protein
MTHALTAGDDTPPPPPTSEQDPEPPPLQLRADSPEALLTIVPHLLGFLPQASLVVIGTEPQSDRIKVTLRYDLPDPSGAGAAA